MIVNVLNSKFEMNTDGSWTTKVNNNAYSYEEINNEDFSKKYISEHADLMEKYQFTFKYEDDHYILIDVEKL